MKTLSLFSLLLLIVSSCTIITSTNTPGKTVSKFPKYMIGDYEVKYPESVASFMEGNGEKTTVSITDTELKMNNAGTISVMRLNDSICYSTVKKQAYLSIGKSPSITVFKIVKKGSDIELYSMFTDGSGSVADLEPYFTSIKDITTASELDDGMGGSVYEVTIDDKKLASYFDSKYPSKEPFTLVRKKN